MVGNDDGVIKITCGCFTVILVVLLLLLVWVAIDGCYSSYEKKRLDREKQELCEQKNALQLEAKEKALQEFAVAESPMLWNSIQELKGQIQVQSGKIGLLRDALEKIGREASKDEDYRALWEDYCVMTNRLLDVERSLEDAYLSSIKYRVSRSVISKCEFERKSLNEGVLKANQAQKKYDDMRAEK